MADTTFVDQTTVIVADWLNDVNDFAYLTINRSAAETTAGVTPSDPYYPEGDIRRYGATTAATTNTTAINAALSVSAAGGAPAYIPPGNWAITTTVTVPGLACMDGAGPLAKIIATGCNGLNFTVSSLYPSCRFIQNFSLNGSSATASSYKGIVVDYATGAGKVWDTEFRNLNISNFAIGIYLQDAWYCTFFNCHIVNCWTGVTLYGLNIATTFDACNVEAVAPYGSMTGSGNRYGFVCLVSATDKPQATKIVNSATYGFQYGISLGQALDTKIEHNEINICSVIGIQLVTVSGGTVIRDNWIQTNNAAAAVTGIKVEALGTPIYDTIVIDGNKITSDTSFAGNIGVSIGSGNGIVSCTNNTVIGFLTGITSSTAHNCKIKGNSIDAGTTAINIGSSCISNEVGPNAIQSGTPIIFSSGSAQPVDFAYYSSGSFTLTLTGMTASTTLTATWVANGKSVLISIPGTTGTSNSVNMTGTGMPQEIRPHSTQIFQPVTIDGGVGAMGFASIAPASGTITFGISPAVSAGFTAAGVKGLGNQTFVYSLA